MSSMYAASATRAIRTTNRRLREVPPKRPPEPEKFSAGRALRRAGILAPRLAGELADDAARGAQAVAERQPFALGTAGGMLVTFAAGLAGLIFLDLLLSERGSRAGAGVLGALGRGVRILADPNHPLFVASPRGAELVPPGGAGGTVRPAALTTQTTAPLPAPAGSGSLFRPTSAEWAGSKSIAAAFASIALAQGLRVTSEKRQTQHTASGGISDHWIGNRNAYAYDLSGSVAQMDRAARALMAALGIDWRGGPIVHNATRFGYRLQVLYRTNVGGNHFDHIHIGVRRVG